MRQRDPPGSPGPGAALPPSPAVWRGAPVRSGARCRPPCRGKGAPGGAVPPPGRGAVRALPGRGAAGHGRDGTPVAAAPPLRSAPPAAAGQRERGPGAAAGAAAAPGSPARPASLLPGPPPPRPPSRLPPGPGAFPKRCPRSRAGGPQGSPSGERDPAPAPGRLKCPEGCVCPRVCQPGCLRCEPGEFRRGRGLW